MNIVLATNNMGKLKDFKNVLSSLNINVCLPNELGIGVNMPEETGKTYEENAEIKARAVYDLCGEVSIGDDSGLEIDALNGEPGIYSARYAGDGKSDEEKIRFVLDKLKNVAEEERTAKFVSCICCVLKSGESFFVRGECRGKIAFEPRGENGFGYCPIFVVDSGKTFAEMTDNERSKINHRGIAINKLYLELKRRIGLGEF